MSMRLFNFIKFKVRQKALRCWQAFIKFERTVFFCLIFKQGEFIYQIESLHSVWMTYKHVAQQIHALPAETI